MSPPARKPRPAPEPDPGPDPAPALPAPFDPTILTGGPDSNPTRAVKAGAAVFDPTPPTDTEITSVEPLRRCESCHAPIRPGAVSCALCSPGSRVAGLEPGTRLDDRYEIVGRLGEGGMATVYEAEQIGMGRTVALKLLDDTRSGNERVRERFRREAMRASQLHHPSAVQIYDFGELTDRRVYLAMELVPGKTLSELGHDGVRFTHREAVRIVLEAARCLAEAHGLGIVHRDVKPSNLMIDRDPAGTIRRVTVLDFGIARSFLDDHLTQTGYLVGTPTHMAPEQCLGDEVDGRADVYALGVILYELLSGEPLFGREIRSPIAIMRAHLEQEPTPLRATAGGRDITYNLESIVQRAIAKDPGLRFADAGVLAAALERLDLLERTQAASPPPAAELRTPSPDRRVIATPRPAPRPAPRIAPDRTSSERLARPASRSRSGERSLPTDERPRPSRVPALAALASALVVVVLGSAFTGPSAPAPASTLDAPALDPVEPRTAIQWLDEAASRSATGDYSAAIRAYQSYLTIEGSDAGARRQLARLLVETGRHGEAIIHLELVVAHEGPDAHVLYELGLLYLHQGKTSLAVQSLERSLEIEDSPSTRRLLRSAQRRERADRRKPRVYARAS